MREEGFEGGFLTGDALSTNHPILEPAAAVAAVAGPRGDGGFPPTPSYQSGEGGVLVETRVKIDDVGMGGDDASIGAGDAEGKKWDFDWPDGYAADPAAMAKFVPLARKLGLNRESAQELAGLYAELDQDRSRRQAEFITENNHKWLEEIQSHPEFGGRNLQRTGESVAATLRRYGSPLLLTQIRQMNVQNWPEMFYFLARVSRVASEDSSPASFGGAADAKSTAQLLFPGLK